MKNIIKTEKAPQAIGPYSQAVEVNGVIYTSGVIPIIPEDGTLVTGSVEEQAHRVFQNLEALLIAAGSDLDHVVKTTVFIKDMNDFARINQVYAEYFKDNYPARSCVEVSRLPKDVLIEVEAVSCQIKQ